MVPFKLSAAFGLLNLRTMVSSVLHFDPAVTRLQSFELEEIQEVHNSAYDDIAVGEAWLNG